MIEEFRVKKQLLGGLAALAMAMSAQATTVTLSYNGLGEAGSWAPGAVATGTGYLEFAQSSNYTGALTLADLSAFQFTLQFTYGGATDVLTYSLADLEDFSALLSGGAFSSFSLLTLFADAQHNWGMALEVLGLDAGEASTFNFDIPGSLSVGDFSAALTPASDVPEPGMLSLLAVAGLGAAAARRRAVCKSA